MIDPASDTKLEAILIHLQPRRDTSKCQPVMIEDYISDWGSRGKLFLNLSVPCVSFLLFYHCTIMFKRRPKAVAEIHLSPNVEGPLIDHWLSK